MSKEEDYYRDLLNRRLYEYENLKHQIAHLEQRRKELNEFIKKTALKLEGITEEDLDEPLQIGDQYVWGQLTPSAPKTKMEQWQVDDLFEVKGIRLKYGHLQVPQYAIQEALINGDITEKDLEFYKAPEKRIALSVERIENVQIEDERPS